MKTLKENIDATLASQMTHVVTGLVEKQVVDAKAIFFHQNGYRVLSASTKGFLTLVCGYVNREKPAAYALITDVEYASDQRKAQPCVLSSCVLPGGLAKNECILYNKTDEGVELGESSPLFLDEPFLKYYEVPLDFTKVNAQAVHSALDLILEDPLDPYMDFFFFKA